MIRKSLLSVFVAFALAGCGGGGDGGSPTPTPTPTPTPANSYNLNTSYTNLINEVGELPIKLASQVVDGKTIRGTGKLVNGRLVTATFEGNPSSLSKMETRSAAFTDTAKTTFEQSATYYYDTSYRLLGIVGEGAYIVVSSFNPVTNNIDPGKITSSVSLYKAMIYSDSSKKTVMGNVESSYSFLPGSTLDNRRWVVSTVYKNTVGAEIQRDESTYLVDPKGNVTRQLDKYTEGAETTYLAY